MRFELGTPPQALTAQQNIESWSVIAAIMAAYGSATQEDLAAAVSQHRHPAGGLAFVKYCVRQGWLREQAQ